VEWLSLDVATYHNRYDDLRSQELVSFTDPVALANTLTARTAGAEVTATAQITSHWQVQGWYAYLWKEFGRDPDSHDISNGVSEANDPAHLMLVRSYVDVGKRAEID